MLNFKTTTIEGPQTRGSKKKFNMVKILCVCSYRTTGFSLKTHLFKTLKVYILLQLTWLYHTTILT